MDLKVFHDTVRFFINKEQGGWLSPEELDVVIDRAQMWHFTDLYDQYAKTQKIQDALNPFVVRLAFTTTSNGLISMPIVKGTNPCYEHLLSAYIEYYDNVNLVTRYKPVKIVSEDELAERLDSAILAPSATDPIGTETSHGKIQLYPAGIVSGYTHYLRRPLVPEFDYTQSDRAIEYREGYSTQLEWSDSYINKILIKTIQMCGVNLSDELILQYTELKDTQDI